MTARIIFLDAAKVDRRIQDKQEKGRPIAVRAEAIRASVRKKPMMKRVSERLLVAENMWSILERLETAGGLSKAKVLHEAGLGRPEESTKRLSTYAVKPGLDEKSRERKGTRLVQHAEKYLRLASVAAKLSGQSEDRFLAELFLGTSYEDGVPDFPDHVLDLKEMIDGMVRWVITEADVVNYWTSVAQSRGVFDPAAFCIRPGDHPLLTLDKIEVGCIQYVPDVPPVPAVELATFAEEKARGRLSVFKNGAWEDRGEISAQIHRILSIAIVPIEGMPRAAFEVRSKVSIFGIAEWKDTDGADEAEHAIILEAGQRLPASIDYYPADGPHSCPFPLSAPPPFEWVNGAEPWYVLYVPVTHGTVMHYCSRLVDFSGFPFPKLCWETSWPLGSLGEAIQANLLYAEEKLDQTLLSDALKVVEILDAYKAEASRKREEAQASLELKWE